MRTRAQTRLQERPTGNDNVGYDEEQVSHLYTHTNSHIHERERQRGYERDREGGRERVSEKERVRAVACVAANVRALMRARLAKCTARAFASALSGFPTKGEPSFPVAGR